MTTTERVAPIDNIAVVRRVFAEATNEGRLASAHEVTKPNAPAHPPFHAPGPGPAGLAKLPSPLRT